MNPVYYPKADQDWARIDPAAVNLDPERLQAAIDFAIASETEWTHDLRRPLTEQEIEPAPYNEIIGPVKDRGNPNGLILIGGRIVAEWGDTARADMTYSATKSYLATCAGLAFDRGMIADLQEPVRELIGGEGFDSPQNRPITWHHLLQQTSEWEGSLWGKPESLDRNRDVRIKGPASKKGTPRTLQKPGTHFEYNDVRVNVLAWALLRLWRRALPEILKESIMDPIGASDTWQWHGYRNSFVSIDGRSIQSVSGGGHWGGGLFISSRDHARFGYLMLRKGMWNGNRLLSDKWIGLATAPSAQNPSYGYMFWLNGDRRLSPGASAESYFLRGGGANIVWIDPRHDMVCVVRWIRRDRHDAFCRKVMEAVVW